MTFKYEVGDEVYTKHGGDPCEVVSRFERDGVAWYELEELSSVYYLFECAETDIIWRVA